MLTSHTSATIIVALCRVTPSSLSSFFPRKSLRTSQSMRCQTCSTPHRPCRLQSPTSSDVKVDWYLSASTLSFPVMCVLCSIPPFHSQGSQFRCVLGNTRRWANPPFTVSSCIGVIGSFFSIGANNQLSITVDDVTLVCHQKRIQD